MRQIELEEAYRGAELALANGIALFEDAKILAEAGRPQRAIVLGILALEEFGKLVWLFSIRRFQRESRMKDWWKLFRSHTSKGSVNVLAVSAETIGVDPTVEDWQRKLADKLDELKFSLLYVEFEDAHFVSPSDRQDLDQALLDVFALCEQSIERHRHHFAAVPVNKFTAPGAGERVSAQAATLFADPDRLDDYLHGREDTPAARTIRGVLGRPRPASDS